jgi:polar amino acid transport system substrate-binding protein
LAGKKIGAQLGSTMEKYAKKQAASQPGLQIVALGKNPLLIQELKSGRLQGVLVENIQAKAFVEANPELKFSLMPPVDPHKNTQTNTLKNINDTPQPDHEGYAIAVSKTNTQHLLQKLNQTLEKFSKNGKLEALERKWFGPQ